MSRPARRRRILLVDASSSAVRSARAALEFEGFSVAEARDAGTALAAALADPPDAVVAAATLPGRSGFDLCRDLKASESTARIPVLLTFSAMDVYDPGRADRAGAVSVLAKPFLASHLLVRIGDALGEVVTPVGTESGYSRAAAALPPAAVDLPSLDSSMIEAIRTDDFPPMSPPAPAEVRNFSGPDPRRGAPGAAAGRGTPGDGAEVEAAFRARVEEIVDRRVGALLGPGGALRAAIDMALERLVRDRVEAHFPEVLERVSREILGVPDGDDPPR